LGDALGAPVVVENRAGAGGRIASEALKHAAPDGATLMLAPIVVPVFAPLIYRNLPFDPARDFASVALVGHYQLGFAVGPSHPAATMTAFAAWAKAHPAQASFGSPGTGGLAHFLGVMIGRGLGVDLQHVAYRGAAPMVADLVGGQIPACIDTHVELIELHRGGRIRVLATTGATRSSRMPDVPTMREAGLPQVEGSGWFAFYVPAATPAATVARLNAAIDRISDRPDVRDRLARVGIDVSTLSPEALDRLAADERARWGPIIRASGFTGD
jgi:tripartite-type tricarboxylate transporter receptor subunit TctC